MQVVTMISGVISGWFKFVLPPSTQPIFVTSGMMNAGHTVLAKSVEKRPLFAYTKEVKKKKKKKTGRSVLHVILSSHIEGSCCTSVSFFFFVLDSASSFFVCVLSFLAEIISRTHL